MITRRRYLLALCLSALLGVSSAHAESPDALKQEAAARFSRAVRLVNAGDLRGSLAEFERVYELVPAPVALYNAGLVYAELGRAIDAVRALRNVVATPQGLTAEELTRARAVLSEQEARIGFVNVTSNVAAGVLEIDSVERAKLPLSAPVEVPVGPHVVGIVSPGYAPARREVLVAGGVREDVSLELVALDRALAHVALDTHLPDADVFVDDVRVGRTPLASTITVAPGTHLVSLKRRGYLGAAQSITLQDGASGAVRLEPSIDPTALASEGGGLALTVSETQALLSLDAGHPELLGDTLRVPAGAHRLRIERGGFLPAERDVTVPLQSTVSLRVELEPTPETRASYVERAYRWRRWSWATLVTGAAVAGGGVGAALYADGRLPAARANVDAVEATTQNDGACDSLAGNVDFNDPECLAALNSAYARVDKWEQRRTGFFVTAGVGGALAVTGLVLLLVGDDPHRYDEPPKDEGVHLLSVAPSVSTQGGGLTLRGVF